MKKLLSYFWPSTKRIQSGYSGEVEVTLSNGKKVLDSEHANYSYGSLQRILKYGLQKVESKNLSKILVLGMGGGSVIETLRQDFKFQGFITAVEIDAAIIGLAKNEFGISANNQLEIIEADAFEYVKKCGTEFSLVIVDLFIDNQVPEKFYSNEFWSFILPCLANGGQVLFNSGMNENGNAKLEDFKSIVPLQWQIFDNVEGTNTLVIGTKTNDG